MSEETNTNTAPEAPAEEPGLMRLLGGTADAVRRHLGKTMLDVPGGLAAWSVLRTLRHTGPIAQADLARRIGVAGSTLTRRLDQMEADGQVTRTADAEDGRRVIVTPTEKTERKHAVREAGERELDRLLAGASEEDIAAFHRVIEQIRTNLRAAGTDPDERSGRRGPGRGRRLGPGAGPGFGPAGEGRPDRDRRHGRGRGRRDDFAARTITMEDGL